jgi:hypothetical protein
MSYEKDEEEENYQEFDNNDIHINEDESLDLNSCEELASSKKLKGKIKRDIIPDIENMSDINSKVMNEIEDIINDIINKDKKYISANESALETLSNLLIHHNVIEDSLQNIIDKNKKL